MVTQNVAEYTLHHVTYLPANFDFEVATSNNLGGQVHLQENILFDLEFDIGVKVTRNITKYHLDHVTYTPAKCKVATSYSLGGDAYTRKYII